MKAYVCVCVWVCVCVCSNVYRAKRLGYRVCVLEKEGVGFGRKCVCVFAVQVVCMEGVETDSRIPFALVSVGLDQV